MKIEFDYALTDLDPMELGKEIAHKLPLANIGKCVNSIFYFLNEREKSAENMLFVGEHFSSETKCLLSTALGVEEEEKPTEKEEEEVFYKVGDRFAHCRGTYKLCSLGNNMVALVKVEKCGGEEIGNIYQQRNFDYSVIDREHITKEEFSRLTSGNPELFTLIK